MVITTSAPAQASATEVAAAPFAALRRPTDALTTSKPVTRCPPLSRFCAIGKPMLPSPMKPMRAMAVPSLPHGEAARAPSRNHGQKTLLTTSLRMLARRLDGEKQIRRDHHTLQHRDHWHRAVDLLEEHRDHRHRYARG